MAGVADIMFPYGTYWMRKFARVLCAVAETDQDALAPAGLRFAVSPRYAPIRMPGMHAYSHECRAAPILDVYLLVALASSHRRRPMVLRRTESTVGQGLGISGQGLGLSVRV